MSDEATSLYTATGPPVPGAPGGSSESRTGLRSAAGALPLGLIFGTVGAATALAVRILHLDRLGFSVCVFKALTGCPCVTCGTTRALGRLAVGDWAGALCMNPLAATATLALVPWALADLVLLPRGRALELTLSPRADRASRWAVVVLLLANWAYLIAAGR